MINNRYTKLIVTGIHSTKTKYGNILYECLCDCGGTINVTKSNLNRKMVKSCGCLRGENAKLGFSVRNLPEHQTWSDMKQRCFNKKNKAYSYYGGRGITMSEEWKKSFKTFYQDMGKRPEGLSLDRIDNEGNYCKENCRWATWSEQMLNRRSYKHNG